MTGWQAPKAPEVKIELEDQKSWLQESFLTLINVTKVLHEYYKNVIEL